MAVGALLLWLGKMFTGLVDDVRPFVTWGAPAIYFVALVFRRRDRTATVIRNTAFALFFGVWLMDVLGAHTWKHGVGTGVSMTLRTTLALLLTFVLTYCAAAFRPLVDLANWIERRVRTAQERSPS